MRIAYPPVPPNESGLKAEIARHYWRLEGANIVVRIGRDCLIGWASDQRDWRFWSQWEAV
jgi:hypothetical protein